MRTPHPTRPTAAVVVLIDARVAVIDRLENGHLRRIDSIRSDTIHGVSYHMGDAPRLGFHGGTRGQTATDAAQHSREAERHRFIARVAPTVLTVAERAWIVVGGNPHFADALHAALATESNGRALRADSLFVTMPAEGMIDCVETAVNAHVAAEDLAHIQALLERAGARARGAVGPVATLDAIERDAADIVLLTPSYGARHPAEAQHIALTAVAKGGRVDIVNGEAAAKLDADAGGVGALLRFVLHPVQPQSAWP